MKLPQILLKELEGTDWQVKRCSRHYQLIVNGAVCALIPYSKKAIAGGKNSLLNIRAGIRRQRRIDSNLTTH